MKKTRILAFVLAVVMLFSLVSVCASAYTYDELKSAVGESNIIYYSDFEGLTLDHDATNTKGIELNKGGTLTEYSNSNLFSSIVFRDYWGGKNNKGPNISSDGHGVVSSEWPSTTVSSEASGDDNNCLDINLVDTATLKGKDMVITTSVTALADDMLGSGAFIYYAYDNYGGNVTNPSSSNNQIKTTIMKVSKGYVLQFGNTVAVTLKKGVTVDIAIHIRIVEPTAPGTYNVNDFSGSAKLTESELTAKYGKVVYDAYVDGVLVAKDLLFVDRANQAKIATLDRSQLDTANEIASNLDKITGLATDYKVTYFRFAGTGGSGIKGATAAYDGEPVFRQDSVGIYLSETYNEKANSANTVEGYDLTLGSKLELNYYLNLLSVVKADKDAKVQFTIGEEVVAEKKVSEVTPDAKGLYKFTCPINSTQMASDIKMSIVSGETTYNIFNNGASSTEYTYTVADYAKYILTSDNAAYTAAKPVVKAMLNYGAYAQIYFADKHSATVGTLANAGYEYGATELDAANFGAGAVTTELTGIKATLVLDTDTKIKIYQGETLLGESAGITADKLDEAVTVECGDKDVTVSVLTVAGKVPAEKTGFKNLAKALALYSQATETYVAAQ